MTNEIPAAGVPAETPRHDPLEEVWRMIEMGWDIEKREWFEREAPKMGFKHPLAMAVHHMHKRCVKENPDFLRLGVSPAAPPPHQGPSPEAQAMALEIAFREGHNAGSLQVNYDRAWELSGTRRACVAAPPAAKETTE